MTSNNTPTDDETVTSSMTAMDDFSVVTEKQSNVTVDAKVRRIDFFRFCRQGNYSK
jgi:hypothetical protein